MASEEQFIDFCSSLGIAFDSDRFAVLSRRVTGDARITVIGLVSRGKSTLINQLAGVELCPVDARGETAAIIEISNGPAKTEAQVESGDFVKIGKSVNDFRNRLPRRVVPTVTWARFSGPVRLPPGITLVDTPGIDDASTVDEKLLYLEKHWTKSGAIGALVVLSVPPGMGRSDKELVDSALRVFGNNFEIVLKATDSTLEKDDLIEVRQEVERLTGKRPILLSAFPSVGEWGNSDLAEVENAIDRMSRRSKEIVKGSAAELAEIFQLVSRTISDSNYSFERLSIASRLAVDLPPIIKSTLDTQLRKLQMEKELKLRVKEDEERAKKVKVLDNQAKDLIKLLPLKNSEYQVRLHGPAVKELFKLCLEQSKIAESAITKLMSLPPETRLQFGLDASDIFKRFPEQEWFAVIQGIQLGDREAVAMVGAVSEGSVEKALPLLKNYLGRATQDQIEKILTASRLPLITTAILKSFRAIVVSDFQALISRSTNLLGLDHLFRSNQKLQESYQKRLRIPFSGGSSSTEIHYAKIFSDLEKSVYKQAVKVVGDSVAALHRWPMRVTKVEVSELVRNAYPIAKAISLYDLKMGQPLVDALSPNGFLEVWYEKCVEARTSAIHHARILDIWTRVTYVSSFILWFISVSSIGVLKGGSAVLWIISFVMWLVTRDRPPANWENHFSGPDFNQITRKAKTLSDMAAVTKHPQPKLGNYDEKLEIEFEDPKKPRKKLLITLFFILVVALLVGGGFVNRQYSENENVLNGSTNSNNKSNTTEIGQLVDSVNATNPVDQTGTSPVIASTTSSTSTTTSTSSTVPVTTTTILGGVITGIFRDVSSPTDFYFSISEKTYLEFRGYGSEGGVDAMFWLYDANENLLATSDDDIGRDPLLLGNAEPGQFRLRVGVCCSPSTPWVGSYRVTFNIEPDSSPSTTTTVAATTTTVAATTTTVAATTTTVATVPCVTGGTCIVGDKGPGGGIVFYVASAAFTQTGASGSMCTTECRYLEAAPANWLSGTTGDPRRTWAMRTNENSASGANGTAIGSGYQNSLFIVAQTGNVAASSAAVLARSYSGGSKSDWFLPSKVELNELCKYARMQTTGTTTTCDNTGLLRIGFSTDTYWSSSEFGDYGARNLFFYNGFQGSASKYGTYFVRPVRAF